MRLLKINKLEGQKNRALITSASNSGGILPEMHLGDNVSLRIELYEDDTRQVINPASEFVLAIGNSTLPSGEFILNYKGETTGPLDANSSINVIETELNKLSTIQTDGGVAVTGSLAVLIIKFRTAGSKELISINTDDLTPQGNGVITSLETDNITQAAYVSQGLIEYIDEFTPVMDGADIVGLDCVVNMNSLAAALSFGNKGSITRTFQFAETLNNNRSTLLKTDVLLKSDLIKPSSIIEGVIDQDYLSNFFLGTYTADPTETISGSPLKEGMFYHHLTFDTFKFYNGSSWFFPFYVEEIVNAQIRTELDTYLDSLVLSSAPQITIDLDSNYYAHELELSSNVELTFTGGHNKQKTIYIDATDTVEISFSQNLLWIHNVTDPIVMEAGDESLLYIQSDPRGRYWVNFNTALSGGELF